MRDVRRLQPPALVATHVQVEGGEAFVRLRQARGQLTRIAELAVTLDQVSECHRITGEDCFLVKIHASSVAGLEEVLDRFLAHGQTVSSIVVISPVPGRPLPVPD